MRSEPPERRAPQSFPSALEGRGDGCAHGSYTIQRGPVISGAPPGRGVRCGDPVFRGLPPPANLRSPCRGTRLKPDASTRETRPGFEAPAGAHDQNPKPLRGRAGAKASDGDDRSEFSIIDLRRQGDAFLIMVPEGLGRLDGGRAAARAPGTDCNPDDLHALEGRRNFSASLRSAGML
jgi:hypothetical protein